MDAEGTLSSGIEGRSSSGTEEKSFDCAEGYGLLRDVEGGLLICAEAWGGLVIGGYSDRFCCKPNTTDLCRLNAPVDDGWHRSYFPTESEPRPQGSLSNLQPVAMVSAVESAVLREERARSCSISWRVPTN